MSSSTIYIRRLIIEKKKMIIFIYFEIREKRSLFMNKKQNQGSMQPTEHCPNNSKY